MAKDPLAHVTTMAAIGEQVVEVVRRSGILHRKRGRKVTKKKRKSTKEGVKKKRTAADKLRDVEETED